MLYSKSPLLEQREKIKFILQQASANLREVNWLISWLSETLVVFKVYQILYHEISQIKKNWPKHFLALQGRVYTHSGQGSDKRALMDFNLSVKA